MFIWRIYSGNYIDGICTYGNVKKQECVVLVPGLNEKKRFLVPDNMQIHEIIHLILELLREEYPELDSEEEMLNLFKRRTGEILKKQIVLQKLTLQNQMN